MKRKKKHDEHVDESWLIPYADILTLLLALFIVLYAASEVNSQKFKEISNSFNNELQGGTGVLEYQTPVEPMEPEEPTTESADSMELAEPDAVEAEDSELTGDSTGAVMSAEEDFEALAEQQKKIESYIEEKGLSARLETELTAKGLILKIKDGILYSPGNATVTADAVTLVEEISELLITNPARDIFIEGHTDNVPTNSAEFPSNWELSAARAINFMKILLKNDELEPQKFSATGYGEYRPIAPNDTVKGRANNRRVEVLISPYEQQDD
ncbi:flagellar motor protein MotB [Planococcus lenghuensis]|uniref:flagellar motor protein MotB n=1 Tax=Planococcus lenghuensis TaxID=2213202 RepID=UPI0012EB670B|nr:flagellar motor protein MotB [Planococcus lenghuensis]